MAECQVIEEGVVENRVNLTILTLTTQSFDIFRYIKLSDIMKNMIERFIEPKYTIGLVAILFASNIGIFLVNHETGESLIPVSLGLSALTLSLNYAINHINHK